MDNLDLVCIVLRPSRVPALLDVADTTSQDVCSKMRMWRSFHENLAEIFRLFHWQVAGKVLR